MQLSEDEVKRIITQATGSFPDPLGDDVKIARAIEAALRAQADARPVAGEWFKGSNVWGSTFEDWCAFMRTYQYAPQELIDHLTRPEASAPGLSDEQIADVARSIYGSAATGQETRFARAILTRASAATGGNHG